jgi:hypothetical protein
VGAVALDDESEYQRRKVVRLPIITINHCVAVALNADAALHQRQRLQHYIIEMVMPTSH